jgi:hypothetical protein
MVHLTKLEFILSWWPHLFSLERWGCFLIRGVWFSSRLPMEETDRIRKFWVVTDGLWYLG